MLTRLAMIAVVASTMLVAVGIGAFVTRHHDWDEDGLENQWEWKRADYSALDATDAAQDPDGDNLPTWSEVYAGLDPFAASTDGDDIDDDIDLRPRDAEPLAILDEMPPGIMRARGSFPMLGYTSTAIVREFLSGDEAPPPNVNQASRALTPNAAAARRYYEPLLDEGIAMIGQAELDDREPRDEIKVEECGKIKGWGHEKCAIITVFPFQDTYGIPLTNDEPRKWRHAGRDHHVAVAYLDSPTHVVIQGVMPDHENITFLVRYYPSGGFVHATAKETYAQPQTVEGDVFNLDLYPPAEYSRPVAVLQPVDARDPSLPAIVDGLILMKPAYVPTLAAALTLERGVGETRIVETFLDPNGDLVIQNATRTLAAKYSGTPAADIAVWEQTLETIEFASENDVVGLPTAGVQLREQATKHGTAAKVELTILQPTLDGKFHVAKFGGTIAPTPHGHVLTTRTSFAADKTATPALRELYEKNNAGALAGRAAMFAEVGADGKGVYLAALGAANKAGWASAADEAARSMAKAGLKHGLRALPFAIMAESGMEASEHWKAAQSLVGEARQEAVHDAHMSLVRGGIASTGLGGVVLLAWDVTDPLRARILSPGYHALTSDLIDYTDFWITNRIPISFVDYAESQAQYTLRQRHPGVPLASDPPVIEEEEEDGRARTPAGTLVVVLSVVAAALLARRRRP